MNPAHTVRCPAARILLASLVLCAGASLHAQEESPPASRVIDGELLYQLGDGAPMNLRDSGVSSEQIQQILEWIAAQTRLPSYGATMKASGTVGDVTANIHVELAVDVHIDDWVRVDAGFPSWTPLKFEYTSADPAFRYRRDLDESNRLQFHLKGKGLHTLSIDLLGEVRDQEADRQRLKLSRPPAALPCDLELKFEHPVEDVVSNSGHDSAKGSTKPQSTVRFWGLNPETEISWERSAATGDQTTVVSAPEPASMTLDLTASDIRLSCDQTINIADGAVDRLKVRLPPGFNEVAITGVDDNGSSIVRSDEVSVVDGVDIANIEFTKLVRGRVDLKFDLRRRATALQETIVVSLPDIVRIAAQSGTVTIQRPPGLNVITTPGALTERTRVEVEPDQRTEATAFKLLSTEAKLLLDVSQQKARYTVQPHLTFSTADQNPGDSQRLLLRAQFPINVSPGSLDELSIDWKQFDQDGWKIFPGTVELIQDGGVSRSLTPDIRDGDTIDLVLDNFYSGRFTVEFQAFRDLDASEASGSGAFHLPDVDASASHDTIVSLVESDTYSLLLTNAEDARGFSRYQSRDLNVPGDASRVTSWLVSKSGSAVHVDLALQKQEVSSTAVVALDDDLGAIRVHTEVEIDVRHRDLSELRFKAAKKVFPVLTLKGESEPLQRYQLDGDEFVWQLPNAIRGRHTFLLGYLLTPDSSPEVRLPLVLPSNGLKSLTVATNIPEVIRLVDDESVQLVSPGKFVAAWRCDENLDSVLLTIPDRLDDQQSQPPSICLVNTHVGPVNITTTTSVFYQETPGRVAFNVPADASVTATVNGSVVDAPKIDLNQTDTSEIRQVFVPDSLIEGTDGVTVSLTCQTPRGPHHHLMSTEAPRYPRLVRAPEWLTTVWLVDGRDDSRLVPLDFRQHAIPGETVTGAMQITPENRISRSIKTALSGLPDSIRTRFWQHLNDVTVHRQPSLAFIAGPQLQTVQIMIYSRALGWLIAAGLGILFYTTLVSFSKNLKLLAAILVPVCVLVWGLLPQQTLALLFPVLPAVGVATVAWLVRLLMQPATIRRSRRRRNTIFVASTLSHSQTSVADASASGAPLSGVERVVQ